MLSSLDTIKKSVEVGEALAEMSEVYTELSVIRLDRIRVKIERNRIFAMELAKTYHEVRMATRALALSDKNKKPALTVMICSNLGFFLGMEMSLGRLFLSSKNVSDDVLVVGRTGGEVLRTLGFSKPFDLLIMARDLPTPADVNKIAEQLIHYDRVSVYFPQFRSVGVQEPAMVDISGDLPTDSQLPQSNKILPKGYILEPEAPKMLAFFEGQIARLLLEQAFLEAELARVAARLLMMDSARQRAEKYVAIQDALLRVSRRQKMGAKILEQSLGYLVRKENGNNIMYY